MKRITIIFYVLLVLSFGMFVFAETPNDEHHGDSLNPQIEEEHHLESTKEDSTHEHHHEHHHEGETEGSEHHHQHSKPQLTEEEKTLLFQETQMDEAYEILQGGTKEQIDEYYKKTGMYAFDMVPDHWYDPANKADLKNQSIFLIISIVCFSALLRFWRA